MCGTHAFLSETERWLTRRPTQVIEHVRKALVRRAAVCVS
ncbi:hypothetical protein GZL_08038 [Streptomyces sp. 769]|nr:hypothetical protein GZL_08038 [Streptomyces sp. 769]